ncbi:hypothetical protein B0H14DRAFT_2588983 [Mycena olivaceomarginata]|nr:hypothetical protein B0H14DRAFT_2588983 [Mycena olivaceomarginata]
MPRIRPGPPLESPGIQAPAAIQAPTGMASLGIQPNARSASPPIDGAQRKQNLVTIRPIARSALPPIDGPNQNETCGHLGSSKCGVTANRRRPRETKLRGHSRSNRYSVTGNSTQRSVGVAANRRRTNQNETCGHSGSSKCGITGHSTQRPVASPPIDKSRMNEACGCSGSTRVPFDQPIELRVCNVVVSPKNADVVFVMAAWYWSNSACDDGLPVWLGE